MKKIILITCSFLMFSTLASQNRKRRPILWTSHSKNTDIIGLALGVLPKSTFKDATLTRTFGVKIEVPGIGILFPLIPNSPVSKTRKSFEIKMKEIPTEKIYGINISSGATYETEINGISASLIGQYLYKINGISITGIGNLTERYNGITISGLSNDSFKANGISIAGFGNSAQLFNGIQIGAQNQIKQKGNGIQIGIFNKAKNFKGIQIGLWNKNQKRTLPFINWNFKK